MAAIRIGHPRNNEKVAQLFVASGVATADVYCLGAVLKNDQTQEETKGQLIVARLVPGRKKHYRWMFLFKARPIDGTYTLTVFGTDAAGGKVDRSVRGLKVEEREVTVTYPGNNEQMCSTAPTAYGTTNRDIESAVMGKPADYIYVDLDLNFWSAQFPDLADGTYSLTVYDVDGNHATATNLDIQQNYCS